MEKIDEKIIPKNFKANFEFIPNLGVKDALLFIPSIITIGLVGWLVPVSIIFKMIFGLVLMFIPFCLVFIRPVINSIPAWKHVLWAVKFQRRQKVFYNQKVSVDFDEEEGKSK